MADLQVDNHDNHDLIMIMIIIILDSLTINWFFSLRKKKEHADTPPSEAEHMVCEVRANLFVIIIMMTHDHDYDHDIDYFDRW